MTTKNSSASICTARPGSPRNAAIWVAVASSEEPPPLINYPVGEIIGTYHRHHFDVFGLSFMLHVGGRLPEEVTRYCAVRTTERYMFFTNIGPVLDRRAAEFFSKSKPSQKLDGPGPGGGIGF